MNAFDKQLNQIASELTKLKDEADKHRDKAQNAAARYGLLGKQMGYSRALGLIKPLINNPILMTFDHKDGFKLEELLEILLGEIAVKTDKIATADLSDGDKQIYMVSNSAVSVFLMLAMALQKEAIALVHGGLDEDEKNARAEQFIAMSEEIASELDKAFDEAGNIVALYANTEE